MKSVSKIPSYADPSFFNFKNGEKMKHPNGGTRGGISWWHPLSAKMKVKTIKKKGLRCKTSWFSVRKYVMTKQKKKKGLCLPIRWFSA